jgi:predicted nucleotidyltransferase
MELDFPYKEIEAYCCRRKITELAVFDTVLRENFYEGSPVNVLVTFAEETRWSLFDLITMQDEMKDLWGREVYLTTRKGVEQSHNPIRREAILRSARPIYQAA